jgi:hypothetical protein
MPQWRGAGTEDCPATRDVTPLREGGSLLVIVAADENGLYVLKVRGLHAILATCPSCAAAAPTPVRSGAGAPE